MPEVKSKFLSEDHFSFLISSSALGIPLFFLHSALRTLHSSFLLGGFLNTLTAQRLQEMYRLLFERFGHSTVARRNGHGDRGRRGLTQNTNWKNCEKALQISAGGASLGQGS